MLPTEGLQLCNSNSALSDMYRSLAVDNVLGCQSASAISWHTSLPHTDEFLQDLVLYLDQIGEVVLQHTSTVSHFSLTKSPPCSQTIYVLHEILARKEMGVLAKLDVLLVVVQL